MFDTLVEWMGDNALPLVMFLGFWKIIEIIKMAFR